VAVLVAAAALSGCSAGRGVCDNSATPPACPPPGSLQLERPPTPTPDVSGLSASVLTSLQQPAVAAPTPYRIFQPGEVQCRAAVTCPLANALAGESAALACSSKRRKAARSSDEIKSQILAYRASEERNKAAGQALEAFYLLAEAEADRDLVRRSKEETAAMLDDVGRLEKQGIRVEKGLADLRRQWPDALDREAQVRLSVEQLNSHLRQLVGLSPDDSQPIWPVTDWKVVAEPLDEQAAIDEGLRHRADLGMVAMMAQSVDDDNVGGVRAGMGLITGMSGGSGRRSGEAESRRSQLNQLYAGRQQAATEEIRLAVRTIEIRLQQIAIAKLKLGRAQEELDTLRLRRTRPDGGVTVLDVGAAELHLIERQSDLVHQVIAWRIAQAKLKEAQGLLAVECGVGCGP
jgi:outer membrane protein TolC